MKYLLSFSCILCLFLTLSACGKKASPRPPGPDEHIIYPRIYPPQ